MSTERVSTDEAPQNDNPYSQGVRAGDTLKMSRLPGDVRVEMDAVASLE